MSRLEDQIKKMGEVEGVSADPLPDDMDQGDSGETDVWDFNDTAPGFDREGVRHD